jgi:predicted nucleic acid-binding protein
MVDTSAWVAALRGEARARKHLEELLDERQAGLAAPVRLELLSGGSGATLRTLRRTLSAVPTFYPTRDTWDLADSWLERTTRAGIRVGIAVLLIGAIAAERGADLWSLDADFASLARLRLLKLHKAAG